MRDLLEAAVVAGLTTDYDCCCTHDDINGDEEHVAYAILSDPAFRSALTEAIAEAHSTIEDAFDMTDAEVAASIVARMLGNSAARQG